MAGHGASYRASEEGKRSERCNSHSIQASPIKV